MTEELAGERQANHDDEALEDGEPVNATEEGQPVNATEEGQPVNEHLQDLPDGSGCTEIWEHIAEKRADDD